MFISFNEINIINISGPIRRTSTIPYHTMGVLPSTQPVAMLALALCCLPLIGLARVVYLTYVEATVFGVGMNVGCDDCNNDGPYEAGPRNRRLNNVALLATHHTIPYHTTFRSVQSPRGRTR